MTKFSILSFLLLGTVFFSFGQRAKNGAYTCTAANTTVNAYTNLAVDAAVNATAITVGSNSLTSAALSTALAAGDLIMIIQMQGATLDVDLTPTTIWGGNYTVPNGHLWDWNTTQEQWGLIASYQNAGLYELAEVNSVSGSTTINLQCGLKNSYIAAGHVQVIRVPRFSNLTINSGGTIVPPAWNGSIGGVVALEVDGILTVNGGGKISATGKGFRGGAIDLFTAGAAASGATTVGFDASYDATQGAEKGESIAGFTTEYNAIYSRYCKSAPGNGGGGGNNHNAGGGGGSNIGTGAYTGKGNPAAAYATAWNLEAAGFATSVSSGGGRGGYTGSSADEDELTVGPNNTSWGGDYRKTEGGLGGHPLTYASNRIFMGGGGGAGDANTTQGGGGGTGGGIVYLTVYGSVTGSGIIEAGGGAGINSNPNNQVAGVFSSNKYGDDAAGGGGGGGAIVISNGTSIPSTIALNAPGGTGGNQVLSVGFGAQMEADGPGGGGAGGMIALTSGTPSQSVAGGANGVTNSTQILNFPPNGATSGGAGTASLTQPFFDLNVSNANACSGQTATLTASVVGTLPAGASINWYSSYTATSPMAGGSSTATFTTPALTATTTYYVGVCGSGTFRKPVVVTIGGPAISGTAVVTNVTCAASGSITGLSASGGVPSLSYSWNGVATPSAALSNASAGTYTLTVTDGAGCTATSGPYTITSTGGVAINTSAMTITNTGCSGNTGSITGITTTGTVTSISWSPGGMNTLDISSLAAGNYTLTVTDNSGCTATAGPFTVSAATPPTVNSSGAVVTNATCGSNNGSIVGITASGTSLTYAWNGVSSPGTDLSGASAGSYTLVVTNAAGCTASAGPFTISASGATVISTSAMTVNDAHCNGSNGSISGITASGGQAPLSYSWNSGAYTTLNLTSIPAGSYSLVVTDGAGCTANAGPFTVNNISGPAINSSGVAIQDQSCTGNDGSITGITVSGTGLTYQWNLISTPGPDLLNQPAGTYYLGVMDAYGCVASAGPFTIGSPTPVTVNSAGAVTTPSTCGNPNGSITGITASGPGLTYSWNGTATPTADLANAAAGTYTLTVTGSNACTATAGPFTVSDNAGPVINTSGVVLTNETCGNSNGSITGITVSGGAPTVNYSWNGGAYTTLDISNLSAGTYSLVVTDGNGCTANAGPYTLTNSPGPVIDASDVLVTNESCTGNDGSITGISVTGTGLSYDWNGTTTASADLQNSTAGSYTLTVTDANGCTATSGPYTINGAVVLTVDNSGVVVSDASCGLSDGSITGIVVSGGINPVVQWSNSVNTIDNVNIPSGVYTLTVTDAQNCQVIQTYTVTSPGAPVISNIAVIGETCNSSNGEISITATGSPTLQYSTDNGVTFQASGDFTNLPAGTYQVIVSDASGCSSGSSATIVNQGGVTITNIQQNDATCGNTDGSIAITASGSSLQYSIDNGATLQASGTFNNLAAGTYQVVVSDNIDCQASQAVTLNNLNGPSVSAGPDQTVCNGSSVTLSGSGAATYSWSGGVQNGVAFTANSTTTYTVTGTDANGCAGSDQVTVTVEPPMLISVTPSAATGCVPLTVTFEAISSGTNCTWSFSDGSSFNSCSSQTMTFTGPGCLNLVFSTVSTSGCVTTQSFPQIVCASAGPDVNFLVSSNTLTVDNPSLTLSNLTTGATSYAWTFGDGTVSDETSPVHLFPQVVGNYDIVLTATDAAGCSSTFFRTIYVDEPLVYFVPNAFSPNSDEFNQTFQPVFVSGYDPYDYNLSIFDRWGELIFESDNAAEGWDGSYQGKLVQSGVYTYRIEFKTKISDERKLIHGQITLLR